MPDSPLPDGRRRAVTEESWLRLVLIDVDYPRPVTQIKVTDSRLVSYLRHEVGEGPKWRWSSTATNIAPIGGGI